MEEVELPSVQEVVSIDKKQCTEIVKTLIDQKS